MHLAADFEGTSSRSTQRIPARAWLTMVALLALYILSFVDRQIIALMVDPIRQSLQISNIQIALVHGVAFSLFYAAAGLPFGWAVDNGSPRWIIFGGVLGWSISTIFCGFAESFGWLFLGRLAVGIGEAALVPAAFSIITAIFPRERLALAASIFMIGSLIGGGAAFAIGGTVVTLVSSSAAFHLPIIGEVEPWRAVFILVGLPGLPLCLLALLMPGRAASRQQRDVDAAAAPKGDPSFFAYIGENWRFFACHLGAFAMLGCAAYGGQGWGPTHVARDFGWSPAQVGLAFAVIIGGFGTAGTFISAAIVDRWHRKGVRDAHDRYHLWTTLVVAPVAVGAFLVASAPLFVAMMAITYLTYFGFGGTATAAMQLVAPRSLRGRIASLYGISLALGGSALGPLLVAFISERVLHDQRDVGTAIAIAIALCTVVAATLLSLARRQFVLAQDRRVLAEAAV